MSKLQNKIEANDKTVFQVLNENKYTVDYFQREYNWQKKHIEQLITDLTSSFVQEYTPGDKREEGENYNNYYLGPFVVSEKDGKRSIIDGQQRLTSITLFLIYLNNLQKEFDVNENLETMIFSELRGSKSFNIQVEERVHCLDQLFNQGAYSASEDDDDSTRNMAERYQDIVECFSDDINKTNLPYFLDWIKYNVIFVEIIAYSDDNAYTIFETMNDRGLNLTSTEMLKGFILSRFNRPQTRQQANALWKKVIQNLNQYEKDEDLRFFQSWLRAKYAETIRPGKAGSKNEDFEKIGTRFHAWVRDNLERMKLNPESSDDFETFVNHDLDFFSKIYIKILDAESNLTPGLEHIYFAKRWGIASSLGYPMMMAPLKGEDPPNIVQKKLDLVARYIECFAVLRAVNFRKFASSSIRYTMYSLVKELRNLDLQELHELLSRKINEMDEKWTGMPNFRMHGQNKRFVKFLLSRISAFIDEQSGVGNSFQTYFDNKRGQPFQIEHIWADHFEQHTDEFEQENEFDKYRNRIGGLVLLPKGTNQSYSDKPYADKLPHYVKENLLAASLCDLTYRNNPNFTNMAQKMGFRFEPHKSFEKEDQRKRQLLYQTICEEIWSFHP